MVTRSLLLLIGSSLIWSEGSTASSPRSTQPGRATTSQTAIDQDSENATSLEAYVGDQRGDVMRVTTCALPGIPLVLADGRIMTWSGARAGDRHIARAAFSNDNGFTWSQPTDLFTFPAGKAQWSGQSGFVDEKGYMHFFGLEYYRFNKNNWSDSESYLWHARSLDGGKTWEPVQRINCGYQYVGCAMSAFQTKTGRIIAPISVMSTRKIGAFISLCPHSDDGGASWKMPAHEITTNTGARDWYESGNAEPVGLQLEDGRLWMVLRSQDGFQWETFSSDDGLTWTPPRHTRFVSNQSQMTVTRLRDGRLLTLWNNCGAEPLLPVKWQWAERTVISAAISDDEGKTWRGYREIMRVVKPGVEVCNPYVVEMSNGRLLVYVGGALLSIDPGFITRTDLAEQFDRGIRRWSTLPGEGVSVVANPEGGVAKALKMVKPKANIAAAACLNFPFGRKGTVTMAVRIEPKFQGAHMTLSDHYDLPGLPRDASFPMQINSTGRIFIIGSGGTCLATPGDLTPGRWHELKLAWDCTEQEAMVTLDDVEIARIHQYVCTDGVCYLRIRSMAETTDDAGMYIKSVNVRATP